MGAPEALFCSILEAEYAQVVAIVESIIQLPLAGLVSLKSVYQRLYHVTYLAIESAIDVIEAQILAIYEMLATNVNDFREDWCRIAYACKPLTDVLFDPDGPLSVFLSPSEIDAVEDSYEEFNNIVCKNGLLDLIDGYGDKAFEYLTEQIKKLRERLNPVENYLDELIQDYLNLVNDSGIYEWLDKLNEWMDCGFAVCESMATALNYQEDTLNKMSMKIQGNSYVFAAQEWVTQVYDKKEFMNDRLNQLENLIESWSDTAERKTLVPSLGKKPDELAKG